MLHIAGKVVRGRRNEIGGDLASLSLHKIVLIRATSRGGGGVSPFSHSRKTCKLSSLRKNISIFFLSQQHVPDLWFCLYCVTKFRKTGNKFRVFFLHAS